VLGTLYPAYASYKAVKTRNVKEYVSFIFRLVVMGFFYIVLLIIIKWQILSLEFAV